MSGPAIALYALGVLIFLFAIMASIALHELGHLHFAKKFGCRVSQYMVGFGPTVWSWKKGETEYGIKLVPLGGYVKIIGMFPPATKEQETIADGKGVSAAQRQVLQAACDEAEQTGEPQELRLRKSNTGLFAMMVSQTRAAEFELVEPADHDRLFYKLPASKKILVMLAGPGVNIAIAFLCFLAVFGIYGTHDVVPTGRAVAVAVSDCVIPEHEKRTACTDADPVSPGKAAGLEPGDEIIVFNGQPVRDWDRLSQLIHTNGSGPMQLTVIRDGQRLELRPSRTVAIERHFGSARSPKVERVGFVGISPESREVVTRHGPLYVLDRMVEMTAHAVTSVVDLPGRVINVAGAILGLDQRSQDGPMSVIGGSRLAGEVASSAAPGLDVAGKAALLGMVVGSLNLFIGIFNLIPLLPLDGGHIMGAAYEGLRRRLAKLFKRPDPGHINVAAQLPLAYALGFVLLAMSMVLMIGDVIVPLSSGL